MTMDEPAQYTRVMSATIQSHQVFQESNQNTLTWNAEARTVMQPTHLWQNAIVALQGEDPEQDLKEEDPDPAMTVLLGEDQEQDWKEEDPQPEGNQKISIQQSYKEEDYPKLDYEDPQQLILFSMMTLTA